MVSSVDFSSIVLLVFGEKKNRLEVSVGGSSGLFVGIRKGTPKIAHEPIFGRMDEENIGRGHFLSGQDLLSIGLAITIIHLNS